MPKPRSTPEQIVTNQIFGWFEIQRFRNPTRCYVFRVKTTGIWDEKRGCYRKDRSRWFKRGISDLIGSWMTLKTRLIRPLAIEIKSPAGYPTPEQKKFLHEAIRAGWIAFVARSVEDVKRELRLADLGEKYPWPPQEEDEESEELA